MRHRFSLLVQKIPWRRAWQLTQVFLSKESHWTEESGGLQFTGSHRVGYDWINSSKEKMSLFHGYSHHPQWFFDLRKVKFIYFFSIYLPWSDATGCQDLSFLKVDFTLIKRLFSSSSLSAIRVVSVAYLSFFYISPGNLDSSFDSASLAFCMIYSVYKLNKQDDDMYRFNVLHSQFWTSPLFHVWF